MSKIAKWFFKSKSTLFDSVEEYEKVRQEERDFKYSFEWWIRQILKVAVLFVLLFISFMLFGCSSKLVTQYELVYVPIKCEVMMPLKPRFTGDVIKDNLLIMKYADEMNVSLKKCM